MRGLVPGTAIGPYVVEAELGRGGMGAVYRARRQLDGAAVALKVIQRGGAADAQRLLRFQREAEVVARLRHPGIVAVHDAGVAGGVPYIAMDLIDGEPLGALTGRVAPLEAARLMAQVARAIEHAHAHGVIHRDLKPDNVLVRRDDGRPVVTDFGLARDLEGSDALTRTGALMGTPHYLSPEQAAGQRADEKSDVYGLGATLYEAITGAPPIQAPDLGTLLARIAAAPPEPPSALARGVPLALDEVVLRALAKDPEERPTASELAATLDAIAEGRADPPRRGGRLALALAALAAASVAVGAAALAATAGRSPEPPPATASDPAPGPGPEATTTTEAAWSEPDWVRALERGDEAALLAAHAVLDAEPELDPRTRERAVERLRALDARWTEPPPGPELADALDRLLWLHWLWRRLEPDHPFERAAEVMGQNDPWRPERLLDGPYMLRVARATVALKPDDVDAYLLYLHHAEQEKLPRDEWDLPLLRAGVERARAAGIDGAWGVLAKALARCLEVSARRGDRSAQLELVALARGAAPLADRAPGRVAFVLGIAGHRAVGDGLLSVDEAARFVDEALRLLAVAGEGSPNEAGWLGGLGYDLHRQAGRLVDARASLERALALTDHPQPGLALRRLLVHLDVPHPDEAIWAAARDLTSRVERWAPEAPERLVEALRAFRGCETIDQLRAAAAPWRDPAAPRRLDP